jgi:hypothetical protein
MAKKTARTKKAASRDEAAAKSDDAPKPTALAPQKVHELFALPGPYDPPLAPSPWQGYVTFWDPGLNINDLRRKRRDLFCSPDWLGGHAFAKQSDSWKWRQIDVTPSECGKPFDEQVKGLPMGDDLPLARELVVYLILHFLATGERLEIPRLRCKDVLASGRRVVVGPFRDDGLDIANVSDRWSSPRIALCSIFAPAKKQ